MKPLIRFRLTPHLQCFELFDPTGSPVAQVNLFLKALQARTLSIHTIRSYGFDLLALFTWLEETNKQLKTITAMELLEFVSYQKKNNLSARTINRRLTTVGVFYRFTFASEIPPSSNFPVASSYYKHSGKEQYLGLHNRSRRSSRKLKLKEPKRLIDPLEPNEVRTFLFSIKRYRDLAMVYFMLLCGLRSMEVRELKWNDINTFEMKFKVRGKGNKERVLPLPEVIKEVLEKYKQVEYPKTDTSELVFVCLQGIRRGKPLVASGIRSLFRYKRKISGIKRANPHRFRHTCGADLARQKLDVFRIQKLLGHEHFSTSLQYINLSIADLSEDFHKAMKNIQKRYGSDGSV